MNEQIDNAIVKVLDFPRKGVSFYDITGIFLSPSVFRHCISEMYRLYGGMGINAIASIESRGFFFAAPLALQLELPLILLRKKGKLPRETRGISYDLEYGKEEIEVHTQDVPATGKILIVDDVLATGGTTAAACKLLESCGASVAAIFSVVALTFLPFAEKLKQYRVDYLIEYQS